MYLLPCTGGRETGDAACRLVLGSPIQKDSVMETSAALRVILVARCSSNQQIEESIDRQLELGRAFCERRGFVVVAEMRIEGKSASKCEHEPQILSLIERKRRRDDFDALYFFSISRLHRSRRDGQRLFEQLQDANILVLCDQEGLIGGGENAWLLTGLHFSQAQSYVRHLASATTTGRFKARKRCTIPHCGVTPYGMDRQFCDQHGTPRFIIRDVGAGRIEMLSPDGQLIDSYQRNPLKPNKWALPGGSIQLVPGDPVKLQTIRDIFNWWFRDGLRGQRIARRLIERGIPSAKGRRWRAATVCSIINNCSYIGFNYIGVRSTSMYCAMSKGGLKVYENPRKPGYHRSGLLTGEDLVERVWEAAVEIQRTAKGNEGKREEIRNQLQKLEGKLPFWYARINDAGTEAEKEVAHRGLVDLTNQKKALEAQLKELDRPVQMKEITRKQVKDYVRGLGRIIHDYAPNEGRALVRSFVQEHGLAVRMKGIEAIEVILGPQSPVGEGRTSALTVIARLPLGKIDQWLRSRPKQLCELCNKVIEVGRRHYWRGVPKYHKNCWSRELGRRRRSHLPRNSNAQPVRRALAF